MSGAYHPLAWSRSEYVGLGRIVGLRKLLLGGVPVEPEAVAIIERACRRILEIAPLRSFIRREAARTLDAIHQLGNH